MANRENSLLTMLQNRTNSVAELDSKMEEMRNRFDQLSLELAKRFGSVEVSDEAPVLKSFDLVGAMEYMKNCSNIIVMIGAGISTSAGIPDFRTPGTGLYSQMENYNLSDPQDLFHIEFFRKNPKPFCLLAKELYPGTAKPTPAHHFLRMLHEKKKLLRVFTQNIDSLERIVGIPSEKLVEAHGGFLSSHCIDCKKEYESKYVKDLIFKDEIPRCKTCSGLIKPDIVFFGESLPQRFYDCAETDFPNCDFLLIMGTSLVVQPFNNLISKVKKTCPRLLLNMEATGHVYSILNPIQSVLLFDSPKNYRDVFHQGACDDGVKEMVKILDWQSEFSKLIETISEAPVVDFAAARTTVVKQKTTSALTSTGTNRRNVSPQRASATKPSNPSSKTGTSSKPGINQNQNRSKK